MLEEDKVEELSEKLNIIIRLLAHLVSQSHETLETKAATLASAGLKTKEIALICGTTPGTISVRLAEARKKRKKG